MNILDKLFKRNEIIEMSEEKVNEIKPEQNKDNDIKKALSYEEMLADDKLDINTLSDELVIIRGVVNCICDSFSYSVNVAEKEDYPLIRMKKISKDDKCLGEFEKDGLSEGKEFIITVDSLFRSRLYTHEGAVLLIKKYYEIREKHLEELFPVK